MINEKKEKLISTLISILLAMILLIFILIFYNKITIDQNLKGKNLVKNNNLVLIYDKNISKFKDIIMPNESNETSFTVYNQSSKTIDNYKISLIDLINTFENNEFVYQLECNSYINYKQKNQKIMGECLSVEEKPISDQEGFVLIKANKIKANITHEYKFTTTFKEMPNNQNYNQGKKISFKLSIE